MTTSGGENQKPSQLGRSVRSALIGCLVSIGGSRVCDRLRFGWIWLKSGWIYWDHVRYGQDPSKSPYIGRDRVQAYQIFRRNSWFVMEREPIIGWVRFAGFSDGQIATQTEGIGPWHWRPAVDCHLDLAVIRFGWVVDGPKSNNEGQLLLGPVFFFFFFGVNFLFI